MADVNFASQVMDTMNQRVQERIAKSNQMDQENRALQTQNLLSSIHAVDSSGMPILSPSETEEAWSRIEQLHKSNKGAQPIIDKAKMIGQKIGGLLGHPNAAMGQRAAQQTGDALNGGPGGTLVSPPTAAPDTPTSTLPQVTAGQMDDGQGGNVSVPYTPPPPSSKLPVQQMAAQTATPATPTPPPNRSMAQIIQAGSPAAQQMEATRLAATNAAALETKKEENAQKLAKLKLSVETPVSGSSYVGEDGKKHWTVKHYDEATGGMEYVDKDSEGNVRPIAGRFSPGAALSVTDAKDIHEKHPDVKFLDMKGDPINFDDLKIGQELVPDPTKPNHYQIATQKQTRYTVNNEVRTAPALDAGNPAAATTLGTARVGTETTATPNADTGGTTTTSKPITSGAAPAQAAPKSAPTTKTAVPNTPYDPVKNKTGINKHLESMAVQWATTGLKPEAKLAAQVQNYATDHDMAPPSLPIPPALRLKVGEQMVARNSAIDIIENIKKDAPVFNSMVSTGKIALATSPNTGELILSRLLPLNAQEERVAANWQALSEHVNLLRGPLGATGFRGKEAWDALQAQRGRLLADPRITLSVLDRTEGNLKALNGADKFIVNGNTAPNSGGDGYGPVEDVVVNSKPAKARKNLATGKYRVE